MNDVEFFDSAFRPPSEKCKKPEALVVLYLRGFKINQMEVTPLQSIQIFGLWDQPRTMAGWEHIKALNMSWRRLRQELKFTPQQLQKIQPEKKEWVQRGALTLHDLPEMVIFPINPFVDLSADLGEVWSMRWGADLLADMGVTYEQMVRRGLNPRFMQHLNYSVGGWFLLKFEAKHLDESWTDEACKAVFGACKLEMKSILRNFSEVESVEGKH